MWYMGHLCWAVENGRGAPSAKGSPAAETATAATSIGHSLVSSAWAEHSEETAERRGMLGATASNVNPAAAIVAATAADGRRHELWSAKEQHSVETPHTVSASGAKAGHDRVPTMLEQTTGERSSDEGFGEPGGGRSAGVPVWARPSQEELETVVRNQVCDDLFGFLPQINPST